MLVVPIVKSPRNTRKPRGTGSHPVALPASLHPSQWQWNFIVPFALQHFSSLPSHAVGMLKEFRYLFRKRWIFHCFESSCSLPFLSLCLSSFPPPTLLAFRISQPALSYIALESLFPSLVQRELWTILKPKLGVIRVFNYQIQCVRQGMEFDSF